MKTVPSGKITVEALGKVDRPTLVAVARALRRAYRLPTRISPTHRYMRRIGYNARRDQYNADVLLDALWDRAPDGVGVLVALTQAGIYVPGYNFLFGLAYIDGHCALISIEPLRKEGAPGQLMRERAAKIAVHEAGHALGLDHCREPRCAMRYADSVEALDRERISFGAACRRELRHALR
jgi:archaemetzincin